MTPDGRVERALWSDLLAWAQAFWFEVVGAVSDCDQYIGSERSRRLRRAVGGASVAIEWSGWLWLAALAWYLLTTPLGFDLAPLATADFEPRGAVFAVLGLALGGPIAVALAVGALVFGHRVAASTLARRAPRAFAALVPPAVGVAAVAVAWAFRDPLHRGSWHLYDEIANLISLAAQFRIAG